MISLRTAHEVIQALGITKGHAAYLLKDAITNGKATGYVESGQFAGVLITAHHAGNRKFSIEIH